MYPTTTHTLTSKPKIHPARIRRLFHGAVGRLIERTHRAALKRQTLRQFEQLLTTPDHLLRDIGLSRGRIIEDRLRFRTTGHLPRYLHQGGVRRPSPKT